MATSLNTKLKYYEEIIDMRMNDFMEDFYEENKNKPKKLENLSKFIFLLYGYNMEDSTKIATDFIQTKTK